MKNIEVAGEQLQEIQVWDGSKLRPVIGKIMTSEGLKDFYRPVNFETDFGSTLSNMSLFSAQTTTTQAVSVGATNLPVASAGGFYVGQTVTITDGVSFEDVRIMSVGTNQLSVTALKISFGRNSTIARSTALVDNGLRNPSLIFYGIYPQQDNMLGNTDYATTPELWGSGTTVQVINGDPKSAKVSKGSGASYGLITSRTTSFIQGEVYTVSFELKTTDVKSLNYTYLMDSDEGNYSDVPSFTVVADGLWRKYEATFTCPVSRTQAGFMLGANNNGTSFEVRKLKMEKGERATLWKP